VGGRDAVREAVAKYTKLDSRSQPNTTAGRLFFTARTAEQQQGVLMMRSGPDAHDVVLVDPNPLSADHTVSVSLVDVSPDGKLLAYAIRKGGEDETEVSLLDTGTKQPVPGGLPKARYFGVAIDAARAGCWYSRWEPKGSRVWYHRFGDDAAKDRMVFGEGLGPVEIPYVQLSENGRWLMVTVFKGSSSTDTRIWVREAAKEGAFASVTDTLHCLVNAAFAGDRLVIRTDWKAPNSRLFVTEARTPGPSHWREIVAERKDAVLESYSVACGRVFAKYLHNVAAEIRSYGLDGKPLGEVTLPGLGNAGAPQGEWEGKDAYFSFASFNIPTTLYRWNAASAASTPWWRSSAPIESAKYEVKQVWCTSADGTRVPMFIAALRGMALDGSQPVLMTGYGGFNISETPSFSARVAAWLDLGGVYVLTNLRGGSEFGEAWHKSGMLANKQHTFDDFIAAGQWLVDNHYCTPKTLGIMGGSNGGLLVGAAMTQRPDLFGAVLCQIPLLDMLRYHQFLIARFWVPEYGSSEDATQFQWLRAYSPYQNLKSGAVYPPVMFVSGDSDTRVDPLHARKMAARMQALRGPNPVLLHYDVNSGHSGGKSVDQSIEDLVDDLQFLRGQLGMAK
jgi:prolyl oligopeptidase